MYQGSGLQTGIGGSDFGLKLNGEIFLYRDRRTQKSIFIVLYHGKVSKKSISKKFIGIFLKRASALKLIPWDKETQ